MTSQHDYSIYHHLVVPTNLENIRFIFNACCDIMLKASEHVGALLFVTLLTRAHYARRRALQNVG